MLRLVPHAEEAIYADQTRPDVHRGSDPVGVSDGSTEPAPEPATQAPTELTPPRSADVSLASLLVLLLAVALAATGQVILKHGMTQAADLSRSSGRSLVGTASVNLWVLLGLVVFGVSALAWLATLSRVPLNVAYPVNALGYLGILAASVVVLHERANAWTVVGSLMVVGGLIVVVTLSPSS